MENIQGLFIFKFLIIIIFYFLFYFILLFRLILLNFPKIWPNHLINLKFH